jgi:hypothetical protein
LRAAVSPLDKPMLRDVQFLFRYVSQLVRVDSREETAWERLRSWVRTVAAAAASGREERTRGSRLSLSCVFKPAGTALGGSASAMHEKAVLSNAQRALPSRGSIMSQAPSKPARADILHQLLDGETLRHYMNCQLLSTLHTQCGLYSLDREIRRRRRRPAAQDDTAGRERWGALACPAPHSCA